MFFLLQMVETKKAARRESNHLYEAHQIDHLEKQVIGLVIFPC